VEQAHVLAVPSPERGEVRLEAIDLGNALAKRRLELDRARAQTLQIVVVGPGSDESGHHQHHSEWVADPC
jgi:hypothetical protein